MKAEDVDGTAQVPQATLGQDLGAIGDKGAVEDREIGQKFPAVAIGRRVADGVLRSFEAVEQTRRRRQPRIHPGDGAAVGLVLPVGGPIRRSRSEFGQRIRNAHQAAVERQLAAQSVQLVEVVIQSAAALGPQRCAQYALGHKGIAVAISADPAAQPKKGWETLRECDARSGKLLFPTFRDGTGTVQGIDFPAPADRKALESEGFNVINRPAFNILYLGINQKNPKLKDLRVRQAIAYALNRQQLVQTKGPGGTKVADEFMPDTVLGYAPDVQKYEYDPEKAKQLLKDAGAEGMTLNFYYPTDVSRPYMPNPQEIFTVLANDLQAVGFKVMEEGADAVVGLLSAYFVDHSRRLSAAFLSHGAK